MHNSIENQELTVSEFEDHELPIEFVESVDVIAGVKCDIYKFIGDDEKDLGIVTIDAGRSTPKQKVLLGDRTVEGYISGSGELVIIQANGERKSYSVEDFLEISFAIDIKIGEMMQWTASPDSELKIYEICFPPYEEGRFENIS